MTANELAEKLREPFDQYQSRRVATEFAAADLIEKLCADLIAALRSPDRLEAERDSARQVAESYRKACDEAVKVGYDTAVNDCRVKMDRLREALKIAATVFEEYGRLHRAKLIDISFSSAEYLSAIKKAERNEKYAQEMRQALKETQP